jgi:hypothetical protein
MVKLGPEQTGTSCRWRLVLDGGLKLRMPLTAVLVERRLLKMRGIPRIKRTKGLLGNYQADGDKPGYG